MNDNNDDMVPCAWCGELFDIDTSGHTISVEDIHYWNGLKDHSITAELLKLNDGILVCDIRCEWDLLHDKVSQG